MRWQDHVHRRDAESAEETKLQRQDEEADNFVQSLAGMLTSNSFDTDAMHMHLRNMFLLCVLCVSAVNYR